MLVAGSQKNQERIESYNTFQLNGMIDFSIIIGSALMSRFEAMVIRGIWHTLELRVAFSFHCSEMEK